MNWRFKKKAPRLKLQDSLCRLSVGRSRDEGQPEFTWTYSWANCVFSFASAMKLGKGGGQIAPGSKFRREAARGRIARAAARQIPSELRPDCLLIAAGRSSLPPGSPCHRPRCEPSFAGPWLNGHRFPFRGCPRTTHAPHFRARSTNAQTLEDRGKGT